MLIPVHLKYHPLDNFSAYFEPILNILFVLKLSESYFLCFILILVSLIICCLHQSLVLHFILLSPILIIITIPTIIIITTILTTIIFTIILILKILMILILIEMLKELIKESKRINI